MYLRRRFPVAVFPRLFLQACAGPRVAAPLPLLPAPTAAQLEWQRAELTMFMHFGVNTFTGREWGDGKEGESLFNPTRLDCKQWVKAAQDGGFKVMILTAKHHDGFCLWQTKQTKHSVASSKWRGGRGDVVADLSAACKTGGMKMGIYLSPWDRNAPQYAGPGYNGFFRGQLTELLTQYGPVFEMWHDGAKGDNRSQAYDWQGIWGVTRKLSPGTVIAVTGPDVRWVGNESGFARVDETSVQSVADDKTELHTEVRKFIGSPAIWYPAECDVSIRADWFWKAAEDTQLKTVDQLLKIYFDSVGRNSVLLLNVPPNDQWLIPDTDAARLREFKTAIDAIFKTNLAAGAHITASNTRGSSAEYAPAKVLDGDLDTYWATDDKEKVASIEFDLGTPKKFNVIRLQEAIALGERVRAYHVDALYDGVWKPLASGKVIGHKALLPIPTTIAQRVRLVVDDAAACPAIAEFGLHFNPRPTPPASDLDKAGKAH